jgi:bloom syndrome protein
MRGWDIMVVAPTGLGKSYALFSFDLDHLTRRSVCFQVPAITLEHGITIVVVPLIGAVSPVPVASLTGAALMKDQVDGLKAKGVQVAMICEKSSTEEEKEASVLLSCLSTHFSPDQVKRQLRMGHPEIRLLYLTPETLFSRRHQNDIKRAYDQKQIRRLVIDEAHVIEVSSPHLTTIHLRLMQGRNGG